MAWQYVASGLPGIISKWEDNDTEEMIRAGIIGPLDGMFIINDLTRAGYDRFILKEKRFSEYQPSQLISFINESVSDIGKAHEEAGEVNMEVVGEFVRSFVRTKGVDFENIWKEDSMIKLELWPVLFLSYGVLPGWPQLFMYLHMC